ncbi:hypothetical protein [Cellulosimicrobium sp. Marseille-Q4280]|uniref:hypothetical protein n=1 Tax=Cellulosimicrobium sp. Marseille-Q4280 TaxID=2937992 RepID=UPI00203FB7DE|nr:hypothetical protein [Cellulosimicrobium sp. Marseille-Q4280]
MTTSVLADVAVPVVHGQGFNHVWTYPGTYVALLAAAALLVAGFISIGRADPFDSRDDRDTSGGFLVFCGALVAIGALVLPMFASWQGGTGKQVEQARAAFQAGFDLALVNDPDASSLTTAEPKLPVEEGTSSTVHAVRDGQHLVCQVFVVGGDYVPSCTADGAPFDLDGDR